MAVTSEYFQNLAAKLVNQTFGGVAQRVTHQTPGTASYDPVTGVVLDIPTVEVVTAIVGPFNKGKNAPQDLLEGDLKMIVPSLNLNLPITNQLDTMILPNGEKYRVISSKIDPAIAAWILQLRSINAT